MSSDFAKNMKAFIFLGQIFGITLFSLHDNQTLMTSFLLHLPFCIVSIVIQVVGFLNIVGISGLNVYTKLGLLAIFGQMAAYFFIRLPYFVHQRDSFRSTILQIDLANKRLGISTKYSKGDVARISLTIFVVVTMASCEPFWTDTNLMAKISYFLGSAVMLYEEFLMDKLLRQIYRQFKNINGKLDVLPAFLNIEKIVPINGQANIEKLKELHRSEKDEYLNSVFRLSDVHLDLCKIVKSINSVFDLSCVMLAAMSFATITFDLFDLSSGVYKCAQDPEFCDTTKSLIDLYLISLILLRLTNVINNWSKIRVEARKTVLLLHKSWNNLALFDDIDLKTKHLILLTVQLNDAQIKITAYGFFELNWPLLLTIIGGSATYVIILIQFRMAYKEL